MTEPIPAVVQVKPGAVANGYPIGMLCAQWNIPFIPGDLNNATTFEFPVLYHEVTGASGADILRDSGQQYTDLIVAAARTLERWGVRAITSNCGFMAVYQQAVTAAVAIPVFLSSLLQLHTVAPMVGRDRRIGVLTANSAALTPRVLGAIGFTDIDRLAIQGLEDYQHFREVIFEETGRMEPERFAAEVLDAARTLHRRAPDIGAIVLECSDLPVYSAAIREATGLPVYDWANYIRFVHGAVVPRRYAGIY